MNPEHHAEQMEALRAEFQTVWESLRPRLQFLRVKIADPPKHEDIAWRAFKAGKEKQHDHKTH